MKMDPQVKRADPGAFFRGKRVGVNALHLIFLSLLITTASAEIRVTGSDLLGADFARAVADFSKQNDIAVKLDLPGTRPGIEELTAGRAEVGLFLLPAGETPPSDKVASRIIAYQVAVVMVPAASPLTQVTVPQLRSIFSESSGDAFTRWGELNLTGIWSGRSIALRALAPAAGLALPLFQQAILGGVAVRPALEQAATPAIFLQRLLAADNTIGVTGLPPAEVPGLRILSLAASPTDSAYGPTPENVHRGSYPLRMPLYVAFRHEAAPELQLFLKFLLSDEAAAALAKAYFLPLPTGARNQLVFELEEMK
jgi:phosphate transport system substrate-binding protein